MNNPLLTTSVPPTKAGVQLCFAVLAGGQGKRVGKQNKGLLKWKSKPLVCHVLDWVFSEAQDIGLTFEVLVISNDRLEEYQSLLLDYNYPIKLLSDRLNGFLGPLAGIETVLSNTSAPFVQCLPCDCPTPPPGLVKRLISYQDQASIIVPRDAHREQPLFSQISRNLLPDIVKAIEKDQLAVYKWMKTHSCLVVDASDLSETFINFNKISAEQGLL
ncbi:NTP transferase domain-containing protein [Thiomicrospira sp. R3]|uniref:molybdenum cofactor guanylyltransferase n=1 Tax=Thiomicrospira sp. R3 TaxID=3035472 RepID=UPI00259B4BC5|nr:NTP transferase domain-containing protein [Thiomicrospira sp. R3]WFE68721.1 NTP transferase domain-containing protein [Thiomicrospira sp. R3]